MGSRARTIDPKGLLGPSTYGPQIPRKKRAKGFGSRQAAVDRRRAEARKALGLKPGQRVVRPRPKPGGGFTKKRKVTKRERKIVQNMGLYGRQCEDPRKRVNRAGRCVVSAKAKKASAKAKKACPTGTKRYRTPVKNALGRVQFYRVSRCRKSPPRPPALKCRAGLRPGRDKNGRRTCVKNYYGGSKTAGLRKKVHKTGKYANVDKGYGKGVYYGKAKKDRVKRPLSNYQKHMKAFANKAHALVKKKRVELTKSERKDIFRQGAESWRNTPLGQKNKVSKVLKTKPKYAPGEFFAKKKAAATRVKKGLHMTQWEKDNYNTAFAAPEEMNTAWVSGNTWKKPKKATKKATKKKAPVASGRKRVSAAPPSKRSCTVADMPREFLKKGKKPGTWVQRKDAATKKKIAAWKRQCEAGI